MLSDAMEIYLDNVDAFIKDEDKLVSTDFDVNNITLKPI